MKKLLIEEKAKRYDEAIKMAQAKMEEAKVFDYDDEQIAHTIRLTTTDIFPELKESEDERIRKELLAFAQDRKAKYPNDPKYVNIDAWIDWLEKQNQNLEKLKLEKGKWYFCIEDYHPRADCTDFYQGEKYRCEKDGVMGVWRIKNPEKYFRECEAHTYAGSDAVRIQSIIQVLEYARSLSAYNQFGKDDITKDIAWLEKQGEQKPAWSEEDKDNLKDAVWAVREIYTDGCGEEELVNWLKSLKDRVLPQSKQEWSDIDKDILFRTIDNLKFLRDTISLDPKYAVNIIDIEREINWLKSLRPQNHWKPSDEQMEALKSSTYCQNEQMSKVLFGLYQDLKKLREDRS